MEKICPRFAIKGTCAGCKRSDRRRCNKTARHAKAKDAQQKNKRISSMRKHS